MVACGDGAVDDIREIASMSEDADKNLDAFTDSIRALSEKPGCSLDAMREHGGFWRVADAPLYFIYCGNPAQKSNRWYFNPRSGEVSQNKAGL